MTSRTRRSLDPADYVYRHAYTSGTTGHPKAIELPGFSPRHALANTLEFQARFGIAGPEHVVRTVIYVVSDDNTVLGDVWRRLRASPLGPAFTTASTLLGVAKLGFTGQLVELDVTAALPG